jgi:hypothetical protein
VPSGPRCQGIGGHTGRHRRPQEGPCGPHVGLCRSRRAVAADPRAGAQRGGPRGERTRAGASLHHPGPPAGAGRLLQAAPRNGGCYAQLSPGCAAQRGCTCRRTGPPRAPPGSNTPRPSRAAPRSAQACRGPRSRRPRRCWDPRAGSGADGEGRTTPAWAAPPPSLPRTGALDTRSQPVAEDGTRAPPQFEAAAAHTNGALHSPGQGRPSLQTGVGQPRQVGTCTRQSRQATSPTADDAARREAAHKKNTAQRRRRSLDNRRPHTG